MQRRRYLKAEREWDRLSGKGRYRRFFDWYRMDYRTALCIDVGRRDDIERICDWNTDVVQPKRKPYELASHYKGEVTATRKVLDYIEQHPGARYREIVDNIDGAQGTITSAMSRLRSTGRLRSERGPNGNRWYAEAECAHSSMPFTVPTRRFTTTSGLWRWAWCDVAGERSG